MAQTPEERANWPPCPGCDSTLQIGMPSGISERGRVFPGSIGADMPQAISWPMQTPSRLLHRLTFPGRHSLIIYLVHQPLFFAGFNTWFWLTGP